MKYRIKEEVRGNNRSYFYVQKKGLLFGWNTEQEYHWHTMSIDRIFTSKEDAIKYLEEEKAREARQKKAALIVEVKYHEIEG